MPRTLVQFALLVVLLPFVDLTGAASQTASRQPFAAIRIVDHDLRHLVQMGLERSPTLRRLVDEIRASRWLVFVQAGRCPDKAVVACLLHFAGAYEGAPYLRIVVGRQGRHPDSVIATIAHELQHVVEVIREPGVVDAPGMREMFRRIGTVSVTSAAGVTYETHAARAIGEQVLRDLEHRAATSRSARK
jgi:hypothetical protein